MRTRKGVSGIYCIRNKYNGKIYIGSAVNIPSRWSLHRHSLTRNLHHSKHLQRSWNKLGPSAFVFEVLVHCPRECLLEKEQAWLDQTKSYLRNKGYNMARVAGSTLGIRPTRQTRAKQSLAAQKRRKTMAPFFVFRDGKFLKKYQNQKDCASELGVRANSISMCLSGRLKSTGRYYFKYSTSTLQLPENPIRSLIVLTPEGKILKFFSARECGEALGIPGVQVSNYVALWKQYKTPLKTCKGPYFKFRGWTFKYE